MKIALTADLEKKMPLNPIWSFGANTCHAPLLLRSDLLEHVKRAKEELGFKYIRCHGTISDGMGVVLDDGTFCFEKLGQVFDNLLSAGVRPFMEISAMPGFLASADVSITHYVFRSAPPKDWEVWYRLVKEMMEYLLNRYGLEELEQWYFEVWNEPDINFWTGTMAEYFKLYDLAAKAIKETAPSLRVGGPATSKTAWIPEFVDHILTSSKDYDLSVSRCDFISTHAYPSDLAFLDSAVGEIQLQNSNVMKTLFDAVRSMVDEKLGKGFPVFCGEWNSSAGPLAPNHDECNNAPYIAKTMVELSECCQGSLYWNLSDIYEECGFHYEPFHGGYGLINVNGIPKSSFYAFKYLNELGRDRIALESSEACEGFGAVFSRTENAYSMLLYYHREPDAEQPASLTLRFDGLPSGASRAEVYSVLPKAGSAYETYEKMERPSYATLEILARLSDASEPATKTADLTTDVLEIPLGTLIKITFSDNTTRS